MAKRCNEKEMVILSSQDIEEILLARMAGGDLYANETRMTLRKVDIMFDAFREKPLYPKESGKKSDREVRT